MTKRSMLLAIALAPLTAMAASDSPNSGGPLGVVSSDSTVLVNGKEADFRGIPAVPVSSGDTLGVTESAARARFNDTNRVEFDKRTKAVVRKLKDDHIFVYLREGGVRFLPVVGKLYICAEDRLFIPVPQAEGFVVIDKDDKVLAHDNRESVDKQGSEHCNEMGPVAYHAGGKTKAVIIISGAAAAAVAGGFAAAGGEGGSSSNKPLSVSPNR
ncbi:MAG: hypothetical protein R2762_12450 [Bryobacteraceae bacterium]